MREQPQKPCPQSVWRRNALFAALLFCKFQVIYYKSFLRTAKRSIFTKCVGNWLVLKSVHSQTIATVRRV